MLKGMAKSSIAQPPGKLPPDDDGRWINITEPFDAVDELTRCGVPWDTDYDTARTALELAGVWTPAATLRRAIEARRMLLEPLYAALWPQLV